MSNQSHILNSILKTAQNVIGQGGVFKAVFDLDSTLFDVTPRAQKILHDFASDAAMRLRFPEATQILLSGKPLQPTYQLKNQLIHLGLHTQPHEFYPLIFDFWKKHFFGNDYLPHDVPYEGAIDYVKEIHQIGANVIYLTGRDVHRMGTGTESQLQQWKLPLGERARLALKPHKDMEDAEFKRDFLLTLPKDNVEIWFFENEPVNVHLVMQDAQHVKIVFFESVHSEKAEPPSPEKVPYIRSFSR